MRYLTKHDPNIFFSIIIPAYNEQHNITTTISTICKYFSKKKVTDYEIVIVNDNSKDKTESVLKALSKDYPAVRYVNNKPPNGFGYAVRKGIRSFKGLTAAIVMADLSDSPEDIYRYYKLLKEGNECVFGSRFIKGSQLVDYPVKKYIFNRLANLFVKFLFRIKYNDTTNAFKAYHRDVIEGIMPLISCHFNLTVEIPLKAIARGFQYKVIPISWHNKRVGKSNLVLEEMGSRYLFIVLYIWLEKLLSKGDYKRKLLTEKEDFKQDEAA